MKKTLLLIAASVGTSLLLAGGNGHPGQLGGPVKSVEQTQLTSENIHQLIYTPPLSWDVHSISIAYDLANSHTGAFSSKQINFADMAVSVGSSNERSIGRKFGMQTHLGGDAGASGHR